MKTPKLTLNTEVCKLENAPTPDIEVVFACGIRIKYTSQDSTIHQDENEYHIDCPEKIPEHLKPYIDQGKVYKSYCIQLETLLEGVETQLNIPPLFPVTFGTVHSKVKEKEFQ